MKISYLDGRPDEVVEEEHFTVKLDVYDSDWKAPVSWSMDIDFTQMCKDAERKVTETDAYGEKFTYVVFPIPKFKKCLRLIHRYSDYEAIEDVQKYLDDHFPKWGAFFRGLG